MPEHTILARPAPPIKPIYSSGDEFVFTYPFRRSTFSEMDEAGVSESPTWEPGVRFEDTGTGNTETFADGLGFQIVTVVATFKPGKFPERIFFTRRWTDPSGKVFGKGKLHIKTTGGFRSLIAGYRHPYGVAD